MSTYSDFKIYFPFSFVDIRVDVTDIKRVGIEYIIFYICIEIVFNISVEKWKRMINGLECTKFTTIQFSSNITFGRKSTLSRAILMFYTFEKNAQSYFMRLISKFKRFQ